MKLNPEFELRYLLGNTPWDSGITPPELMDFIASHQPGRALEFGCGTGTNAITLAQHDWQVTALDVSLVALLKARWKAFRSGVEVTFIRADAAEAAEQAAVKPPYDLALDIGCFHALETERRQAYAGQLPQLVAPQGTYLLYSFLDQGQESSRDWPQETDIRTKLKPSFDLTQVEHGHFRERPSAWFTFRRRN